MKARWLLLLGLVACAPPVESGDIINKAYTPAHTESEMRKTGEICSTVGKVQTCSPIYTWVDNDIPDKWELQLRDCPPKEDCREGWKRVDETTYHQFDVGMHYPTAR